jgi:hypothetical protein
VQFIENSMIGVRAAYLRLSSGPSKPDVCLFPMIHIGSESYYAEVKRRLEACDLVLYEGVKSFHGWMLTRSYSIAVRSKRLGLVPQREALAIPLLQQKKIHADVNTGVLNAAWRRVPLRDRLLLEIIAPLHGLWLYLTATRESIGRRLNIEEVESTRDFARAETMPEFDNAIINIRDARLVEEVSAALADNANSRIGIVYGAGHMRAVSRLLTGKYNYRVVESEWISVFDYPD